MAIHGQFVSDDSKYIYVARDEGDGLVRVFLHESWYRYFKPLYDYAETIAAGIEISEVPSHVESSFEWLSTFATKFGAYGWVVTIAVTGWIIHLAKNQISIGKFTYEDVGWGDLGFGEGPFGGGTRILELPVGG